jgi:MFS family permease
VCGLAWTPLVLIGARLVQGCAAGVMVPQVLTLIQLHAAGAARARAVAAYGLTLGIAVAAGQVLGGVLINADLAGAGWRPVFLVNVPIGVVLLAAGWILLPGPTGTGGQPRRGVDLAGVALLSAAVLALIVPLAFGHDIGWPAWTWFMLGFSPVTWAALVTHLARRRRRGAEPLVDLSLLRRAPARCTPE